MTIVLCMFVKISWDAETNNVVFKTFACRGCGKADAWKCRSWSVAWAGIGDCIFILSVFYMNKKYMLIHLYMYTLFWAGIGDWILVLIVFYMNKKYTFIHLYIYTLCCTSYVSEGVTSYPCSATWCSCPCKMFMFTFFLMVIYVPAWWKCSRGKCSPALPSNICTSRSAARSSWPACSKCSPSRWQC